MMEIGIIGGGPAGLSTALKLNQLGHKVLVLEAGDYSQLRAGEHLAAKGKVLLQNLGLPENELLDHSIPCTETLAAWGNDNLVSEASIYNPYGDGIILSRPNFDKALATYCQTIGIKIKTGFRVRSIERTTPGWQISNEQEALRVDFIVDASGRTGRPYPSFDNNRISEDELIGISRMLMPVDAQHPNHTSLMVESIPEGWWYSVQLANGQMVATLMTDASILNDSGKKQVAFWNACLNESFYTRQRCEGYSITGKLFTQSAKTQYIDRISGTDWLAVGDAAISYDPLSSAGILKGLEMGDLAARRINDFFDNQSLALSKYQDEVKTMYAEYLSEKIKVYGQEKRFMHKPFWYRRLLKPKELQKFSILPQQNLVVSEGKHSVAVEFLSKHFPEIDCGLLIALLRKHSPAHVALKKYLFLNGEAQLTLSHFQILESLIIMGILTPAKMN